MTPFRVSDKFEAVSADKGSALELFDESLMFPDAVRTSSLITAVVLGSKTLALDGGL